MLYIRYNDGDSTQWVVAYPQLDAGSFLLRTGDTMTGDLFVNSTTDSVSVGTGALRTSGGLSVVKNANIAGNLTTYGTLAAGATTINGTLTASGGGTLGSGGAWTINGATTINNTYIPHPDRAKSRCIRV
jgi:hypothetical protein